MKYAVDMNYVIHQNRVKIFNDILTISPKNKFREIIASINFEAMNNRLVRNLSYTYVNRIEVVNRFKKDSRYKYREQYKGLSCDEYLKLYALIVELYGLLKDPINTLDVNRVELLWEKIRKKDLSGIDTNYNLNLSDFFANSCEIEKTKSYVSLFDVMESQIKI